MANDLLASLKTLLSQFQEGEKNATDLIKSLNQWAREIGEIIKDKVEEEVESSVKKMGFVKREDFLALQARVKALEGQNKSRGKVASTKKSENKKSAINKRAKSSKRGRQ